MLSTVDSAFNFIWVPDHNLRQILKADLVQGLFTEVREYRFAPQGTLGNMGRSFGLSQQGIVHRVLLSTEWGEARDAGKHCTMHKTVSLHK